ncbi:MAG: hypothetical protein IJI96_02735 [Methanobrevibacter sp.]|nr:hypothetical protein [Methanobrevibacter sp.]MBQ6627423.1 hypothetical protein [Methanobrevibacter sp.]
MNIGERIENILEIVQDCLEHERQENGLLENVKDIITVYNNEYGVDTPGIWIVQHPVTADSDDNLSQELTLKSTIEFVCIEYDPDPETAEKLARNLAEKVAISIKKNYRRLQYEKFNDRIIHNVKFNSLLPVGEINVENKREKIPVTGLILEFLFDVDWENYC